MNEYDIEKAFAAIEEELLASMMRNLKRHREWEDDEGFHWSMWQAEQLKALEQYKKQNSKKFKRRFNEINRSIREIIEEARKVGGMDQELEILEAINKGWKQPRRLSADIETAAEFFRLNTRKLEALIKATEDDFKKAETAMLRMANDQYRQVIFNAQVYANTGAGTYEKAVDMATQNFRARGINCIEYKNGARHTMKDYAGMAIRTASKRAYLTGEGEKRQEWGISTVIINKRGNPCPLCLPFVGKILIDDVWSGGKAYAGGKQRNKTPVEGKSPSTGNIYPLMSSAVAAGLYHPNCKDSHSTYFEGISTPPDDKFTKAELVKVKKDYAVEQRRHYIDNQTQKYCRMANYAMDEEEKNKYRAKEEIWAKKKVLDPKDFNIENVALEGDIAAERDMLFKAMNVLPKVLVDAAKGSTKFKIGEIGACRYDYNRDIMHISKNATFEAIVHEFGHLLENKILDAEVVEKIKHEHLRKVNPTHVKKATFTDFAENELELWYVDYPGMVSAYHGTLYKAKSKKDAFRAAVYLKEELLWEYISEPFKMYIINPDRLKYLNKALYNLFEETLK